VRDFRRDEVGVLLQTKSDVKYVLCNADEVTRAYMTVGAGVRSHSVLEGMLIGAKAIGAHMGYIYCRAEYPLAVKVLNIALTRRGLRPARERHPWVGL